MRAFDFYLLGFVEFEVDASDFTEAIALFLRNGIRIRSQCQSRLTVFRHQKSDAFKLLSERNIKYNITRKFAVFDSAADNMRLLAIISAAFLTAVIVTFLSGMVWCIEVDGNVEVSDGEIIYGLEQCGFGIGSFWSKKDIGEIENQFLLKNEEKSIIFTGGEAKYFANRIKNAIFAKCDLVVCGLNSILEYNASEK